jgi:hypothetical protein
MEGSNGFTQVEPEGCVKTAFVSKVLTEAVFVFSGDGEQPVFFQAVTFNTEEFTNVSTL